MSVSGFKINNTIERYNYGDLDNIDVLTSHIHDEAVTADKLADEAVTADKLADEAVTADKIDSDYDASLAKVDGAYEQMTVGNAEQLVSTVGINDNAPYNFRTSGGSVDIGDRETDKIVGGTICWNQLFDETEEINLSVDSQRTKTTAVPAGSPIITGHKYLMSAEYSNTVDVVHAVTCSLYTRNDSSSKIVAYISSNISGKKYNIFESAYSGASDGTTNINEGNIWIYFAMNASDTGASCVISKLQLFDLTAMFGSAIADYVYALERSNAGSGVAYFRKLFPKAYYAYNSGELLSVQTSAHKMVGFNQWDEEYLLGYYKNDGVFNPSTSGYFSSKNKIPVIPSTSYHIKVDVTTAVYICYYDGNGTFVERATLGSHPTTERNFTTPSYCCFINFSTGSGYGTTYNHDICINLSWDGERDGDYEAYTERTYPLDTDLTLRGIPKLDANNNLYYDGDTYESDGTVMRRYGVVDLGTLTWAKPTATNYMNFYSTGISSVVKRPSLTENGYKQIICSKYSSVPITTANDNYIYITASDGQIRVKDTSNASLTEAEFKTAMSGVYLVYELATPTAETADLYANPQIVDDWGTEEYVDTRAVAIPVGHETYYANNLRAKLEMSPNSPSADGLYLVKHENGINTYVAFIKELPMFPTEDGTYSLKFTKNESTTSLYWLAEV